MATGIQTNRTSIAPPAEISAEILQKTQEQSAVMQLARQIQLPGTGSEIPVITSDPEAGWVSETGAKPVSNPGLEKKTMTAYKLAVLVPFSNEFQRDLPALYDALVERLPGALAYKFDQTVAGAEGAPGSNFDTFANCETQNIGGVNTYQALVDADADIAKAGGLLNGFAISPQAKAVLLGAVDGNKRPLFINNVAEGAIPMILGARTVLSKGVYAHGTDDVVGIAGDWTQALYGTVEGVKIDYSTDGTIITGSGENEQVISLFQNNMFAVRAEIEIGFVADTNCFNLLTVTP